MRKVIVQEFVTIDNFAAQQDKGLGFMPQTAPNDQENTAEKNQLRFIETLDTMIMGRNTYEMFRQYWPSATEIIAPKLNALRKIVFSSTLDEAPWGDFEPATLSFVDAREEIARLKELPGKDIVIWGSLTLVRSLYGSGVIDEYSLIICPAILEKGIRLFTEGSAMNDLELIETKTFTRGFIQLRYGITRS